MNSIRPERHIYAASWVSKWLSPVFHLHAVKLYTSSQQPCNRSTPGRAASEGRQEHRWCGPQISYDRSDVLPHLVPTVNDCYLHCVLVLVVAFTVVTAQKSRLMPAQYLMALCDWVFVSRSVINFCFGGGLLSFREGGRFFEMFGWLVFFGYLWTIGSRGYVLFVGVGIRWKTD